MDARIEKLYKTIDIEKLLPFLRRLRFQNNFAKYLTETDLSIASSHSAKLFLQQCVATDEREFIQLLLHANQDSAALALDPRVLDLVDLRRCDPRHDAIGGRRSVCALIGEDDVADHVLHVKEHSMSSYGGIYPMLSSPRGLCVLVNNYFTFGTYKEMQRFRHIFYQFHFDVVMEKNLSAKQLVDTLRALAARPELADHNAFVFMILTHGNDRKEILGFDGEPVRIEFLTDIFNNQNCPLLQGKPRLFFFNCCRGKNYDFGVECPDSSTHTETLDDCRSPEISVAPSMSVRLPTTADYLVCYSTLDGYVAYANWDAGTNFGRTLAHWLVTKGWYKDINTIITRTNGSLEIFAKDMPYKQLFEWNQCLTKLVYFNPSVPDVKPIL